MNGLQGDNTHCFELFGFDILLDSDLRPWVLEVNVYPSLSSGSKLDKQVKTALMCDLFTLVGAPLPGEAPLRDHSADQELLESLSEEFSRTGAFDLLFPRKIITFLSVNTSSYAPPSTVSSSLSSAILNGLSGRNNREAHACTGTRMFRAKNRLYRLRT